MSKGVKPGTGAASQHSTNKQWERGPGVTNTPLKKSTVNPTPPILAEGKSHSAGAPKMAPEATAKKGASVGRNTVLVNEGKPAGRNSSSSQFTAPRKEGSHDPIECGYTKPGKM